MHQRCRELLARGVSPAQMLYVSFEDERLSGITVQELNRLLEIKQKMTGGVALRYLFPVELQNLDGWEHFARRSASS